MHAPTALPVSISSCHAAVPATKRRQVVACWRSAPGHGDGTIGRLSPSLRHAPAFGIVDSHWQTQVDISDPLFIPGEGARNRAGRETLRVTGYNGVEGNTDSTDNLEIILEIGPSQGVSGFQMIAGHANNFQHVKTVA